MRLGEAKWIGAAAAVAVVVGLTVGGAAALKVAGGGGPQPEDVLPANAIAFAKLDLNPSAGQKVAAYRLASKFPTIKNKVTSEGTSIKESILGSLFTGPKSLLGLDYKKDVEPWLGDRIGVGVFPDMDSDKKPEIGIAVAVTDEKAAKVALDKAIVSAAKVVNPMADSPLSHQFDPATPSKTGYAFTGGFVILSDTKAKADALVKAGKAGMLADSKYADDLKALDSDQFGVAWADIAAVYKAIPKDLLDQGGLGTLKGSKDPKNASGRVVIGLHADPSFVEVTGKAIDLKGVEKVKDVAGTAMIASFPADVFGAFSMHGLGTQLATVYTMFTEKNDSLGVKSQLNKMGIRSAKEIETLFGAETGVVVGGTKAAPEVAVRTRGAGADAALVIARRVIDASSAGSMGITAAKITGPDGIVVGRGDGLTAAVSNRSGAKLGDTEAFKQVIPDADKAQNAEFVDLAKIIQVFAGDSKDAASLKAFKALGVSSTGGSEPAFRLRVSFK